MRARAQQNGILKELEENNFQLLFKYPAKISFESEWRYFQKEKQDNLLLEDLNNRELFKQKENNHRGKF